MSGLKKLADEEKKEMIEDGKDNMRGMIFQKARMKTQEGNLDDYIDFLSQNMELIELLPTKRLTRDFRL
ncbi:MAG: hypothetical protein JSU83_03325 [Deltaproteobacteria bacterium]|nr:MAG: hypothetical protein JSU83_03325 [Deltaproteobacteria bacterium]